MDIDAKTKAALEALEPQIKAMTDNMGAGLTPEKLKAPASVAYVNLLIAEVTVLIRNGAVARIKELEAKVEALESSGVRYCGIHQKAQRYKTGDVTTADGAMWTCIKDAPAGAVPGKDAGEFWQLSAKRHESGLMTRISAALETKIATAQAAAAKAVAAQASIAKRAASRAEEMSRQRRKVEKTRVTKHDDKGRIAEFEREIIEQEVEE